MATARMAAFFGGPWDRQERRVSVPEPFEVRVPIPLEPAPFVPEPPELPSVDFVYRVARYERRLAWTSTHERVWVYVCVDDGLPPVLPKWTISVITPWDGEEGDELFDNVATVEARTAEDAERIYGDEHPYDRDYCVISARPLGAPW